MDRIIQICNKIKYLKNPVIVKKNCNFFLKKGLQKERKSVIYIVTYQTDLETTRDEEKRE